MKTSNGMSNNSSKNTTLIWIAVIAIAVLALGYFLFTSSPQNVGQTAAVDDMHGGGSGAPTSEQLNSLVGKPMPDIQLSDKDGKNITAADLKGKYTVLFFNEGLMCYPACWNQIASFGADERGHQQQQNTRKITCSLLPHPVSL